MSKPLLIPPCPGWLEDLPGPAAPPIVDPWLERGEPSHIDATLLEINRSTLKARGLMFSVALFTLTILMYIEFWRFLRLDLDDFLWSLIDIVIFVICVWAVTFAIRVDISLPRHEPLRFNRPRQRIYAYNFSYRWWNPFERWRVVCVAYDWSQVRAERWMQRGATAQGIMIMKWGVVLSVVEPGTHRVIDRFPLSTMGGDEFAWAYICTYMQQGPNALPPPGPARNHDDVPWYNLALRLAPEVKWPEDMDRESRTAS